MKTFRDFGIDLDGNFSGDRKVLCPRCSHLRKKKHEPCLSVNGDKGTWNCHNCGWTGSLHERRDSVERKEYRRPCPDAVSLDIDARIVRYFSARGIGTRALNRGKVFSTIHYLAGTGQPTLCIAFPYYHDGELVNIKYRDGRKNMTQEKDPEPCLWNIDACHGAQTIYITEGEIDALSLIECGYLAAVSVDKGAPNAKDADASKKMECIETCREVLDAAQRIVLVTDKDEPGLRLERELISVLGCQRCCKTVYPADCKDINDVLVKYGPEGVTKVIDNVIPVPVPGLHRFAEYQQEVEALYKRGGVRGFSTGWPVFDRVFSLAPGTLNIVTGYPSSGKSQFVQALAVNTVKNLNWKWAIFSPEMMPVGLLSADFLEKIMHNPFFGRDKMTEDEMRRGFNMLNESFHLIYHDDRDESSLDSILDGVEVAVSRYGVKGFILDPWNWMDIAVPSGMGMTDYMDLQLRKCRQFAIRTKIWFCIVAHPRKPTKDPKTGKLPVATLMDISGSQAFHNKADYGLSIYRDMTNSGVTQVHVLKSKNRYIAEMNTVTDFRYDIRSGTYTDIDPNEVHRYTATDAVQPRAYID